MQSWLIPAIAAGLVAVTAASDTSRVQIQPRPRSARNEDAGRRAAMRVSFDEVVVPVTVLDGRGAPVRGLVRGSFRVFEDGVEQQVTSFTQDELPASIGIVLDASRSMQTKLSEARAAVARLFEQAMPGDEYQLVEFNDSPRLLCELTRDTDTVRRALETVAARGWTALFDAIFLAAHSMRNAGNSRRALVVISDGEDNFSRYDEGEVRSYLAESDVVIYSIGLSNGVFSAYQYRHLRRLSEATGGWCYGVSKIDHLGETVRGISSAIRSQYVLSYSSTNPKKDGRHRRIRVQLDHAGHPDWRASWRTGYHAPEGR